MNADLAGLEIDLCSLFDQEAGCYSKALKLAENLPDAFAHGRAPEDDLNRIVILLDQVARLENEYAERKKCWQDRQVAPGPKLAVQIAIVRGLVGQLAERLQGSEREATAKKNQLLPELDAFIRGKQMQRAYRQSTSN